MLRKAVVKCPKTQPCCGGDIGLQVVDVKRALRIKIQLLRGLEEDLLAGLRAARDV